MRKPGYDVKAGFNPALSFLPETKWGNSFSIERGTTDTSGHLEVSDPMSSPASWHTHRTAAHAFLSSSYFWRKLNHEKHPTDRPVGHWAGPSKEWERGSEMGWPHRTSKNTRHSAPFEFHINNKSWKNLCFNTQGVFKKFMESAYYENTMHGFEVFFAPE